MEQLSFLCRYGEDKPRVRWYNGSERRGYGMEWIDRMNQSLQYIEEHLTDNVDYAQLGQIACCSAYHYQRMFTYMAGVPLSEYIRRRRMSLAAVDLQGGDAKIVDVAAKYGYSSPTAFNRAFQAVHGVAPSAVRGEGVSVKSHPPITFKITIKGAEEMEYRIERRDAFRIIGVSAPLDRDIERNFAVIPKVWGEVSANGTLQTLAGMMDAPPMGILGVCACSDKEPWKYFISVSSSKPAGIFEEYTVPAATWAIFPGSGTGQSIQQLEQRIVTEWLPTSGYEYADGPDVEVYLNADPENARYEVWIPVKKK